MLAAEDLLKSLTEEDMETYTNCNDDHDFSKVLESCGGNVNHNYEIMCSDGQKRIFSFDN